MPPPADQSALAMLEARDYDHRTAGTTRQDVFLPHDSFGTTGIAKCLGDNPPPPPWLETRGAVHRSTVVSRGRTATYRTHDAREKNSTRHHPEVSDRRSPRGGFLPRGGLVDLE